MATTKTPAKKAKTTAKTRKAPAKTDLTEAEIAKIFGGLSAEQQAKVAEKAMKRDAKNAVAKKVKADKKAETNKPGLNPCELTEGEKNAKIKAKCCFVTVKKIGTKKDANGKAVDIVETYRHVGQIVAPAESAPYRISIATGMVFRVSGDTSTDRDRLIRQTVDKAKNTPEIADWLLAQAGFTK